MPSEVSDIKQFIEICRRKDASCAFFPSTLHKNVTCAFGCAGTVQ